MSKKGQDNQRGITFQNKVALLYMLDNYKYHNFLKIKLEGDQFEDFTLFFRDIDNKSSFFCEFEVKNWKTPLTLNNVRDIIKKELKKNMWHNVEKGSFFIVASSFSKECKEQIKSFKKNNYLFGSYKDFYSIKDIYKQMYGSHPILDWSKEEILFFNKRVNLKELDEESVDKRIQERFHYEQSFFYTKENAQNIISRLFKKITEKSSVGGELTKQWIEKIITEFCNVETKKSESYDLNKDLGQVIQNIEQKLQSEDTFAELNADKYITPISKRERAVFDIVNELKTKKFQFKKIKWFFDKILIKDRYMLHSLDLLKQYAKKEDLDSEDKDNILQFIFKLYEYESRSSSVYQHSFDHFYRDSIFKILSKLSETNTSDDFKQKIQEFLNKVLPDWETTHQNHIEYEYYRFRDVPKIIKNILGCTKEGIKLVFKKYDFTRTRDQQDRIHYNYIEKFINQDFENNFPVVVKGLVDQFTSLYKSYGFDDYDGSELSGGGYFGSGGRHYLQAVQWESLLSNCVTSFYNQKKNWACLKTIINTPCSKENPVFVKRSFIPVLLQQLQSTSEKNPEENKFYKALESILEIKKGLPTTEDVVIDEIYRKYLHKTDINWPGGLKDLPLLDVEQDNLKKTNIKIPSSYLNLIIKKILYKYSKSGISYNILMIQLIMRLIESGELQFKEDLKRILLNKDFQKSHIYEQTLRILSGKTTNQNIKEFFNEIKNQIDISQNKSLMYENIAIPSSPPIASKPPVTSKPPAIEKLFKSSSKKDLDNLADILHMAFLKNNSDFIKKVLTFMDGDLEGFYQRAKVSEYLMQVIAQMAPWASSFLQNEKLAEKIMNMCINDIDLCGESKILHEEIIKKEASLGITTMRAHLCCSINSYVSRYCREQDKESLKKLEQAFLWIKILIDLDGSLAKKIPGFPSPNYYLRYFAIMPLLNLSYYRTRKNLNKYKPGLGDEVKNFAFAILEQTEQEIEINKYHPVNLLNQIGRLFNVIRDLDEREAKKVLYFIRKFNIAEEDHLFIYYAVFREKDPLFKGIDFKTDWFKEELKKICKGKTNSLKGAISFTIYKRIENQNKETNKPEPDFNVFEKVKDYWVLLFKDINKNIRFSLIRALAIVLDRDKSYYDKYNKYFFILIKKTLESIKESEDSDFLHWKEVLQAVSKHAPDDLTKILFLFLDKGNKGTGWIPFHYEVINSLIPEIKKQRNKITKDKVSRVVTELKKYNICNLT